MTGTAVRRHAFAVVLLVLAATFRPTVAQQSGQTTVAAQQPTFRATVDLVQLDVSVLDKKTHHPVRGLKASDFVVFEDDRPQPIEAFSEIVAEPPTPPPAPWMREVSADVVTNDFKEKRLFLIVMDDVMLPADPLMVKNAKAIAHGVVDRMGPDDLATVIFTRENNHAQDFTADRVKLLAAIDQTTGGFNTFGVDGDDSLWYEYSVRTVSDAADALIAIPERRKTLVYISPGVPLDPQNVAQPLLAAPGNEKAVLAHDEMIQLHESLEDTFGRAERSNVNVYALDPGGLNGVENWIENRLVAQGSPVFAAQEAAHNLGNENRDELLEMADNTGGRAVINTNAFDDGLNEMFVENASYYLLGYRQLKPKGEGHYNHLDVKVDRPDVEVRSRHYNYTPKSDETRAAEAHKAPPSPAAKALAGLLPDARAPLQATFAPFGGPAGADKTPVAVVLHVAEAAPSGPAIEHVDLALSASDPEGRRTVSETQKAVVTLRPAADGSSQAEYEVLGHIDLKPGRYEIRLAVHDVERNATGSVFGDVEVPDFSKEPLSLSGAVMESAMAPFSAPKDALKGIVPVVPTTRRSFAGNDEVTAFARVYEGGRLPIEPVVLVVSIKNDHDVHVWETARTIAPASFKGRAAPIRIELPFARLAPGPYLLSIETTMGEHRAARDVVFRVAEHGGQP